MISKTLVQIASQQTLITSLVCAALLTFASFFVGMLIWTTRRGSKSLYQEHSQIPFQKDPSYGVRNEVQS